MALVWKIFISDPKLTDNKSKNRKKDCVKLLKASVFSFSEDILKWVQSRQGVKYANLSLFGS